ATVRQSRSRQPARRSEAPTIDRETVLKINRRPLQRRHRSCDNFWPPRSPSGDSSHRDPSPLSGAGGVLADDQGEFAIDSRRYGSHDSIHFDERIRRQHKIEPLRTLFDRENVVLTDWGQRPHPAPTVERIPDVQQQDKNDNRVYGSATGPTGNKPGCTSAERLDNHKALRDDDCIAVGVPERPATPQGTDGPVLSGNCLPAPKATGGDDYPARKEVHPPEPPPRRYYLPMDKIASGELEAMLCLFQDTPITPEQQQQQQHHPHRRESPIPGRRSATPSYIGGKSFLAHERSHSVQGFERHSHQPPASLVQDGVESKPPLKLKPSAGGRTTPQRSVLQRHPTVTDVSCIEDAAVEKDSEFNLNSNTGWNLNIDRRHELSNGDGKPPKQSYASGGHTVTPTLTCDGPGRATSPTAVSIGPDQLTTNYFDKHREPHPTVRFPLAAAGASSCDTSCEPIHSHCCTFPLTAGLEIERRMRQDHKFDSNVNCTGYRRPSVGREFHNYNEKLITDTDGDNDDVNGPSLSVDTGSTPLPWDERRITETRCQPHSSALNVSNQPNRNWINLNSNQIYHQHQRTSPRDPVVCQRVSPDDAGAVADAYHHRTADRMAGAGPDVRTATPPTGHGDSGQPARETHVAYGTTTTTTINEHANDNLQRFWPEAAKWQQQEQQQQHNHQHHCNYDNKSVRSHYHREASPSDNGQLPVPNEPPHPPLAHRYVTPSPPLPPYPLEALAPSVPWRPRARSGSSGSSVKINEIFEFPPPPPYPCDCAESDVNPAGGEPRKDLATTPDDSGRDYSTSDRIDRPEAQLSTGAIVGTTDASPLASATPCIGAVNPTTFPSCREGYQPSVDLTDRAPTTGCDNDVNAHPTSLKHRGSPEPRRSCSEWNDQDMHRPPGESFRNVFHSATDDRSLHASSSNVDVDYFKTNLTDDKTPDANANSARNFDEEPNKYDTRAPQDESIDPVGPQHRFGAENSAPARAVHGPARFDVDGSVRSARMISFTDGEFIFGPFDERSLEFGRFELLSDKLHGVRRTAPGGTGTGTMLTEAAAAAEAAPSDTDNWQLPAMESTTLIELENSVADDDKWKIAHSSPEECQQSRGSSPPAADYSRWARFENGNISPTARSHDLTANGRELPVTPPPTSPSSDPTKRRTRGEEIEDIFQQLNHSLKANASQPGDGQSDAESATKATLGQLVENVPVIERILDDLLTFSKQLLEQKQLLQERKDPIDGAAAPEDGTAKQPEKNREMAPGREINDDNLINLLATGSGREDGREMTFVDGGTAPSADRDEAQQRREGSANDERHKNRSSNNDANSNQEGDLRDGSGRASPPQQEDPFTSVAIFNWNPLDVYQQQQGLFMIDPRFALADMRAISPLPPTLSSSCQPAIMPYLPTVPEESVDSAHPYDGQSAKTPTGPGQPTGQETDVNGAPKTPAPGYKMDACHNYCPASVDPPMLATGSSATIRPDDNVDKIVQMNQVLHCYEPDNRRQREPIGTPVAVEEGTY
uniref:Uncharacterized protein n=1 Tax=Anopheles epiroticus TaxID=199890 RepID=A0A182PIH1_9DIPT